MLCKRHCSGVKPAVNNFRYTVHVFATVRALNGYSINIWTVKFYFCRFRISTLFSQLCTASDRFHMTALTLPYIQRCSPVTVTGNTPILNVLQPVTETSFSNGFRNPVYSSIVANQIIFDCCHFDEPGLSCIVDQRSITSPAMWIAMLKFRCVKKQSFFFQVFQYHWICLFHKYTFIRCLFCHLTFAVYQLNKRKVISTSYLGIIFTKCRCDMNHTGTIGQCNVISTCDKVAFFVLFLTDIYRTVE